MALRISTSKNHRITSKMLNDRVNDVMGGNALISGFNINKESESVLSSSPGKCIINGAIIEGALTGTFAFDEVMMAKSQAKILIRYNHEEVTATSHIQGMEYELASNELLLATVKRENNVITEIIQEPYTVTLNELTRITNELEDATESPITNVSGRDIKVDNSDYGKIENISIKGQTYHNLVTDENIEKSITGTLTTDSLCSHKIENTKAGLVDTVISGRTLQNLIGSKVTSSSAVNSVNTVKDNGNNTITITRSSSVPPETHVGPYFKFNESMLKLNKEYTIITKVIRNTLDATTNIIDASFQKFDKFVQVTARQTGYIAVKIATTTEKSPGYFWCWTPSRAIDGEITFTKPVLLEGDWTNVPIEEIPCIDGIQSAGETENNIISIKSCGKNLFDKNNVVEFGGAGLWSFPVGSNNTITAIGDANHKWIKIKLPIGKTYSLIIDKRKSTPRSWAHAVIESYSDNVEIGNTYRTIYYEQFINNTIISTATFTTTMPYIFVYVGYGSGYLDNKQEVLDSIQIEEAPSPTLYEAHKESIVTHALTEPLRSLPSGVCDEIVGNKLIRRVGKAVFNGSENWGLNGTYEPSGNSQFTSRLRDKYPLSISRMYNSDIYCDTRPVIATNTALNSFWIYNGDTFVIQFPTSVVSTPSLLSSWLAANPTTVYYELATPVIEELTTDTQLNTFPGVTYIASPNLLIPKTKVDSKGTSYNVPLLKPDTKYTVKWKEKDSLDNIAVNLGGSSVNSTNTSSNNQVTLSTPIILENNNLYLSGFGNKVNDVIVVEGDNYEPNYFKGIISAGTVNTPTLPNGVHDELIGNDKVIKRIEKVIFDGSENWVLSATQVSGTISVYNDKPSANAKYPVPSFISYNLPSLKDYTTANYTSTAAIQPMVRGTLRSYLRINNDELETFDISGAKKWLSKNPVTLWYELDIPVINDYADNYYIDLKSCGPNLIEESNVLIPHTNYLKAEYIDNKIVLDNSTDITKRAVYVTPVYLEKGKEYIFSMHNMDAVSGSAQPEFVIGQFRDSSPSIQIFKSNKSSIWVNNTGIYYARVATPYGSLCKVKLNIQFEQGNKETPYTPYKESIISYALTQPLRSLPNGVCDEIIGNKVIRRIGKVVLNGSENWRLRKNLNSGISTFSVNTENGLNDFLFPYNNKTSRNKNIIICDNFVTIATIAAVNSIEAISKSCISVISNGSDNHFGVYINIEQSKLTANSEAGFKSWLSSNPATLYYELLNPIEEELPIRLQTLESYDYTTYISSISNLSPIITADIITNLSKTINQNSSRLSILEDLIDGVIIPGLVDTDYRNVIFGFNYNF